MLLALVLGASSASPGIAVAQCEPLLAASTPTTSAGPVSFSCRFDATLTRTFTPPAAAKGTYRVYLADAPIEKVVAAFKSVANSDTVRGAWSIRAIEPLDAFGEAGPYDATRVARLYAGRRARVARGPLVRNGRTVASITVVSPYPDPSLTRLETGSLIIEYRISTE